MGLGLALKHELPGGIRVRAGQMGPQLIQSGFPDTRLARPELWAWRAMTPDGRAGPCVGWALCRAPDLCQELGTTNPDSQ